VNSSQPFFDETAIRVLLLGLSVIDFDGLNFEDMHECQQFVENYGYDLSADAQEIEKLRLESIDIIQNQIISNGSAIPFKLLEQKDIIRILYWSSRGKVSSIGLWACAVLRVMHTLVHSSSYFNEHYHREIRKQIVTRIESHLIETKGSLWLGDIELQDFHCRPLKTRQSVAIKLLHKTENISVDIFDWIGIRFITKTRIDALKVISYLRANNIIMLANVKPSRSRNSLIDSDWLESFLNGLDKPLVEADDIEQNVKKEDENIHSHNEYRAIQFTCRQRIRIQKEGGQMVSFFFPFEVQVTDKENFSTNQFGPSSHEEYKRRQLISARKRVLGRLYSKYAKD
jgi:uncharacterized protein (TIGR04562 family)